MRVTFCTFDFPGSLSGPNSWLRRALPMFEKAGIDCEVIFIAWRPDECSNIRAAVAAGLKTFLIDQGRHPTTEQQIREILIQIEKSRPDIFVANMIIPALYAGRWIKQAGIPTVGVMRSDDDFYWAMLDQFVCGAEEFKLSGLVCVSEMLEKEILRRNGVGAMIQRIPSGSFVPETIAETPVSDLRLIYLGRLQEEQKCIGDLAKAFCRAARELEGVRADIFGDGPDRQLVERILATEGIGLPVHLRGRIEPEKVMDELLARHVLVLMSAYEGTPVALMEAMAAGVVPICLWTRSGIPELVEDGVTGLVIRDRGDDFIRAVRRLKNDPALWKRLSLGARARIEKEYSQKIVVDKWIEFLKKLYAMRLNRTAVEIPKDFGLPHVHPSLASWDRREPTFIKKFWRLGKRLSRKGMPWLHGSTALRNSC